MSDSQILPAPPPLPLYAPAEGAPPSSYATATGLPPAPAILQSELQTPPLTEVPAHLVLKSYARVKIVWHVEDLLLDEDGEDWTVWSWDNLLEYLNDRPAPTWEAYVYEVRSWLRPGAFKLTNDIINRTAETGVERFFPRRGGTFQGNKRRIALCFNNHPEWRERFEDLFAWVFDETLEQCLQKDLR